MCILNVFYDHLVIWIIFLNRLDFDIQLGVADVEFIEFFVQRNFVNQLCEDLNILDGLKKLQLIYNLLLCVQTIVG